MQGGSSDHVLGTDTQSIFQNIKPGSLQNVFSMMSQIPLDIPKCSHERMNKPERQQSWVFPPLIIKRSCFTGS